MRKTGLHVNAITPDTVPMIVRAKAGFLKSLDHNRAVWADVRQRLTDLGVQPFMIGRHYFADQDPMGDWQPYFKAIAPEADRMRGVYDAWEYLNEVAGANWDQVGPYADQSIAFASAMHAEGHKVVGGNFSVGNPIDLTWWDRYFDAVLASDYLGLHEYDAPAMWSHQRVDEPVDGGMWYCLRYRRVRARLEMLCRQRNVPISALPPIVITEMGIDGGVIGISGGWRQFADEPGYVRQLEWYERELQKDAYVLGATIFCAGVWDPQWHSFDVENIVEVADWIAAGQTGGHVPQIGAGFAKTADLVGPFVEDEIYHAAGTDHETSLAIGQQGYATWRRATNTTVAHRDDGEIWSDLGNDVANQGQMVKIFPKA